MKLFTILGIMLIGASGLKAQDCNPNPPQGMQEIAAYSIFQGNYSNGDYPFALKYGRWMICTKPTEIEGYLLVVLSFLLNTISLFVCTLKLGCLKMIQAKEKPI